MSGAGREVRAQSGCARWKRPWEGWEIWEGQSSRLSGWLGTCGAPEPKGAREKVNWPQVLVRIRSMIWLLVVKVWIKNGQNEDILLTSTITSTSDHPKRPTCQLLGRTFHRDKVMFTKDVGDPEGPFYIFILPPGNDKSYRFWHQNMFALPRNSAALQKPSTVITYISKHLKMHAYKYPIVALLFPMKHLKFGRLSGLRHC